MGDIVERLRRDSRWEEADHVEHLRMERDEYKQLYADALRDYVLKRNEVERLRAALREIASIPTCPGAERERLVHVARAALEGKDDA